MFFLETTDGRNLLGQLCENGVVDFTQGLADDRCVQTNFQLLENDPPGPVSRYLCKAMAFGMIDVCREKRTTYGGVCGVSELGGEYARALVHVSTDFPVFIDAQGQQQNRHTEIRIRKPLDPDRAILLLEPVLTDGMQAKQVIDILRSLGYRVQALVCVLDDERGGTELLASADVFVHALYVFSDLVAHGRKCGYLQGYPVSDRSDLILRQDDSVSNPPL